MMNEKYDIVPYRDTSEPNDTLRVYRALDYTRAHGPGGRFSLWLQGCLKRCPGCSNQQMLDLDHPAPQTQNIPISDLLRAVTRAKESVYDIEGITIQGGEPMIQARNLALFLEEIKATISNFHILVFSGYSLENLRNDTNQYVQRVLACTDTLIDGVFENQYRDNTLVRGSHNQRLHHFSPNDETLDFRRYGREVSFDPSRGTKTSTGIRLKTP